MTTQRAFPGRLTAGVLAAALMLLAGCNTGESTEPLPDTSAPAEAANYTGPAPVSDDVQTFKRALWDNLAGPDRCGACHNAGGQSPQFVHEQDINTAYREANRVVNLERPSQSALVTKVAEGHNCWQTSDTACADIITQYISNWAGESSGTARTIELRAPAIREPGATLRFPDDHSQFEATVHPLLTAYCSDCHTNGDQTPYIGSSDPALAYEQSRSRISLESPASSRLVQRLAEDSHNCWDDDCDMSAEMMALAIADFAGLLDPAEPDPELVASKALNVTADGLLANAGGRYQDHVIALYEFKTGTGQTAFDTSGVDPALNLSLTGNVDWVGGWGIEIGAGYSDDTSGARIRNGKAQGSTSDSRKLYTQLTTSGEYSIEAWVVPANTTQEDTRILTYSGSAAARNLTIGQDLQSYQVFQRSSSSDQSVPFATDNADERLQATLQHLVVNYTPASGRQIFINGQPTGDIDPDDGGLFSDWDDTYALVLGNETSGDHTWEGTLRMVAIHKRALTPGQIQANYEAGVGQKFLLLFSVSHLTDIDDAFVVFEVSQFDNFSYLFKEPFFISLDDSAEPNSIPVEGMRLGINGSEPGVGQAFANLDITLNRDDYEPGQGQAMSGLGTVIALENGPDLDEFFLTFERFDSHTNAYAEAAPPTPVSPSDRPTAAVAGLRTFDELNASMAKMTGVAITHPGVSETFAKVQQQLPSAPDVESFQSAHQMGITQLAIQYCDALVSSTPLRSDFFMGFDFNAPAETAFDHGGKSLVSDALIARFIGSNLNAQPEPTDVETELGSLIDRLTVCPGGCSDGRTETVVKAGCAAVLGSAVTLLK